MRNGPYYASREDTGSWALVNRYDAPVGLPFKTEEEASKLADDMNEAYAEGVDIAEVECLRLLRLHGYKQSADWLESQLHGP
jgi:hypothetical protein